MMCEKEQLIAAVFKKRPIWDPRHWKHHDRTTVQRLWGEIELELGVDKERLKTRWRGLRDYFGKELRKMYSSSQNDCSDTTKPTWPYFEMMIFLKDIWNRRGSRNQKKVDQSTTESSHSEEFFTDLIRNNGIVNLKTEVEDLATQRPELIVECVHSNKEGNTNDQFDEEINHTTSDMVKIETRQSSHLRKRSSLKRLKTTSRSIAEFDEDLLFFKSLIPDLKTFPRSRKIFFKLRVQEMLYHEISALQGTELQSHDMPTCPSSEDD